MQIDYLFLSITRNLLFYFILIKNLVYIQHDYDDKLIPAGTIHKISPRIAHDNLENEKETQENVYINYHGADVKPKADLNAGIGLTTGIVHFNIGYIIYRLSSVTLPTSGKDFIDFLMLLQMCQQMKLLLYNLHNLNQ